MSALAEVQPELIAWLFTPERRQDVFKPVMVNHLHQSEQATDLPLWKSFTGEPVQIIARQICNHRPLVLAKGHFTLKQQEQIVGIHEKRGRSPVTITCLTAPSSGH